MAIKVLSKDETTTAEMAAIIRNHRGDVCVGVLTTNDVFYVKAVKADLIHQVKESDLAGSHIRLSVLDGVLYVDNAT